VGVCQRLFTSYELREAMTELGTGTPLVCGLVSTCTALGDAVPY
jgi:hypothetical protein